MPQAWQSHGNLRSSSAVHQVQPPKSLNPPKSSADTNVVRRIVVIDDDEGVASAIAKFLQFRGYEAAFATSGAAGIALVLETVPDAVVCDIRMPGLGGEQVLLVLKAQPKTSHIPVVMVTGFCSPELVGMGDAFLVKPFKCNELVDTIEHLPA